MLLLQLLEVVRVVWLQHVGLLLLLLVKMDSCRNQGLFGRHQWQSKRGMFLLSSPLSFLSPYINVSFFNISSIKEIPQLYLMGDSYSTVIAFASKTLDVFKVSDAMSSKGWHLNSLQRPNCVHLCVTYKQVVLVDTFLKVTNGYFILVWLVRITMIVIPWLSLDGHLCIILWV